VRRRVLILNENESVPHDRQVWQISFTLLRAGYEVTVICPAGTGDEKEPFERREGVEIHRYPPRPASRGAASYASEYAWAFWHTTRLLRRITRGRSFDVVHACNPPDFLLVAALVLRRRGARFIFDHHDLVPELYMSRFMRGRDPLYYAAVLCERLSFRLADVVISTNDTYRERAIARGKKAPEDVFVVRHTPDLSRFRPQEPDRSLKRDRPHLLSYVGVMGPQDGVDHALRALALLRRRRSDWHALLVGDGDVVEDMQRLATELGLAENVEFTGWLEEEDVLRVLSATDVCLAPDPKNPLNDASSMVKIVEYMAMARPIVSYDLRESRATAGGAALYARPNDAQSFAAHIEELLDDPGRRERVGRIGRERVERGLSWEHSERALLAAYDRVLATPGPRKRSRSGLGSGEMSPTDRSLPED
jgi:glycosyltransferase involved in cell wall biosynthesis